MAAPSMKSGDAAVRRPPLDAGPGPRWRELLIAAWGHLRRANDRLEASFLGNVLATACFAFLTYALFFIGGILQ